MSHIWPISSQLYTSKSIQNTNSELHKALNTLDLTRQAKEAQFDKLKELSIAFPLNKTVLQIVENFKRSPVAYLRICKGQSYELTCQGSKILKSVPWHTVASNQNTWCFLVFFWQHVTLNWLLKQLIHQSTKYFQSPQYLKKLRRADWILIKVIWETWGWSSQALRSSKTLWGQAPVYQSSTGWIGRLKSHQKPSRWQ